MQVLVKWYNIYNAPGGPSAHAEWSQFVTCFMTLMGYNTERLAWTRHVSQLFLILLFQFSVRLGISSKNTDDYTFIIRSDC